jgi:Fe-Mn family superoxide dismutase
MLSRAWLRAQIRSLSRVPFRLPALNDPDIFETSAARISSIQLEDSPLELQTAAFEVPALTYAYEALEPYIDAQTMTLHHDKHHKAYVDNANAAIEKAPELKGKSAEEILANLAAVPEAVRGAIRNNVGGHVNHSMFWAIMAPSAGGAPTGSIAGAIAKTFGDLAQFQEKLNDAGVKQFGSGWTWLALGPGGLQVLSTPNQDNPISQGLAPIMGNDVWEHAYYLKYQNRRAEYLKAWWNVVNWAEINKRYEAALKK